MGGIARDASLTVEQFRDLLSNYGFLMRRMTFVIS